MIKLRTAKDDENYEYSVLEIVLRCILFACVGISGTKVRAGLAMEIRSTHDVARK